MSRGFAVLCIACCLLASGCAVRPAPPPAAPKRTLTTVQSMLACLGPPSASIADDDRNVLIYITEHGHVAGNSVSELARFKKRHPRACEINIVETSGRVSNISYLPPYRSRSSVNMRACRALLKRCPHIH